MFEDHLVQSGIISLANQSLRGFFVKGPHLFHEQKEGAAAIFQMGQPMLFACRPEGVDIKADMFPFLTVTVALQSTDLVEGHSQIGTAKRFVLIKFKPVLVVQVNGPELAESAGKIDLICGVESGQDGVR